MKDFRKIAVNRLRHYNALDAASTLDLYRWQRERMGPFLGTWRNLHQGALHALARVERWGAILDEGNVKKYDTFLGAKIERAQEKLRAFPEIPPGFNVKSAPQMNDVLGKKMCLKSPVKTATGNPSWGDDALAAMQEQEGSHPCIPVIRDLLAARSMRSSYGEGQLKYMGYDGRVHTTYNVIRSGRLSSRSPNLQNLKSPDDDPDLAEEDDDGKWARGCWVCPPGYVWVNLDYSQNELRVAAILSGDEAMIEDFNSGVDFHFRTASRVFGKKDAQVTKLERRVAKVVNFRTIFGGTDFGLAQMLKISEDKAKEYSSAYFDAYPRLAAWLKEEVSKGQASGSSWAIYEPEGWVHRRPVPDIGESGDERATRKRVSHAERVCQNNPIQNIANCFGLSSLARAVSWIEDTGVPAELNLTVHDNLALYAREDVWQDVAREVRRMMVDYDTGPLPLKVDVEMGPRDLGHLEKVKLS
jgi:DNA polymerase-1